MTSMTWWTGTEGALVGCIWQGLSAWQWFFVISSSLPLSPRTVSQFLTISGLTTDAMLGAAECVEQQEFSLARRHMELPAFICSSSDVCCVLDYDWSWNKLFKTGSEWFVMIVKWKGLFQFITPFFIFKCFIVLMVAQEKKATVTKDVWMRKEGVGKDEGGRKGEECKCEQEERERGRVGGWEGGRERGRAWESLDKECGSSFAVVGKGFGKYHLLVTAKCSEISVLTSGQISVTKVVQDA